MMEALSVAGVPSGKLHRKSVVSSVVNRQTWMGGGETNLLKCFKEHAIETDGWVNEGVCGVETDDAGLRFYDLAGSAEIGKGGWATPADSSDNNLWYEPTAPSHGPIIYDVLEDVYGTWTPQSDNPYERTAMKTTNLRQIELSTPIVQSGADYTVNYRTEGALSVGTTVRLTLSKWNGSAFVPVQVKDKAIATIWNNAQAITFTITASGQYKIQGNIINTTGSSPYISWYAPATLIFVVL